MTGAPWIVLKDGTTGTAVSLPESFPPGPLLFHEATAQAKRHAKYIQSILFTKDQTYSTRRYLELGLFFLRVSDARTPRTTDKRRPNDIYVNHPSCSLNSAIHRFSAQITSHDVGLTSRLRRRPSSFHDVRLQKRISAPRTRMRPAVRHGPGL